MQKSDSERLKDETVAYEARGNRIEADLNERIADKLATIWTELESLDSLLKLEGETWFSRSTIMAMLEELGDIQDAKPARHTYLTRSHDDVEDY